jgi:hypothetical protein
MLLRVFHLEEIQSMLPLMKTPSVEGRVYGFIWSTSTSVYVTKSHSAGQVFKVLLWMKLPTFSTAPLIPSSSSKVHLTLT